MYFNDYQFSYVFQLSIVSPEFTQNLPQNLPEFIGVDLETDSVQVKQPVKIPYILTDDDDFNLLPTYSDLSRLTTAMKAASVLVVPDGGGNKGNDNNTVPFILNTPEVIYDDLKKLSMTYKNDRQSVYNETNEFWVVYVCSMYQAEARKDGDPNEEMGTIYGIAVTYEKGDTSDIKLTNGMNSALIFRETVKDISNKQDSQEVSYDHATPIIIAHEVGHQFGLGHGNIGFNNKPNPEYPKMGIMFSEEMYKIPYFIPRHINIIRSRTASPGENP